MNKRGMVLVMMLLMVTLAGCGGGGSPSGPAFPPNSFVVTSTQAGTITITGNQLNIPAYTITINYDPTTLTSPQLTPGPLSTGFLSMGQPQPGEIRVADLSALAPITGSGTVATITYTLQGNTPVRITSVTATGINDQLGEVPLSVYLNP